jgi:hypothetical protein
MIKEYVDDRYKHPCYEGLALSILDKPLQNLMQAETNIIAFKEIPKEYQHYFYITLGEQIGYYFKGDWDKVFKFVDKFESKTKFYLYEGVSSTLPIEILESLLFQNEKGILEDEYKKYLYHALGLRCYMDYSDQGLTDRVEQCLNLIKDDREKQFFSQGLIHLFEQGNLKRINMDRYFQNKIKDCISKFSWVDEKYLPYFYRALGTEICFKTFGHVDKDLDLFLSEAIDKAYMSDFYYGWKEGLELRYRDDSKTIFNFINSISENYRGYLLAI